MGSRVRVPPRSPNTQTISNRYDLRTCSRLPAVYNFGVGVYKPTFRVRSDVMRSGFLGIRHPQRLRLETIHHRHHLAVGRAHAPFGRLVADDVSPSLT